MTYLKYILAILIFAAIGLSSVKAGEAHHEAEKAESPDMKKLIL
jgi:hypothetical protein